MVAKNKKTISVNERSVDELIKAIQSYKGPDDDHESLELFYKLGNIDNPRAIKFLMGKKTPAFFGQTDLEVYKIVINSLGGYLERQKLDRKLLGEAASLLVELTRMSRQKYGTYRPDYAKEVLEDLVKKSNPIVESQLTKLERVLYK